MAVRPSGRFKSAHLARRRVVSVLNSSRQRLYFFWDYDISDDQVRHMLRHGSPAEKAWIITRILEYAKWDDIWRYLTVKDIRQNFDRLCFRRSQDRELWAYALDRWHAIGSTARYGGCREISFPRDILQHERSSLSVLQKRSNASSFDGAGHSAGGTLAWPGLGNGLTYHPPVSPRL